MTILYVFPHPDDESFGPGPVMAKQKREGHRVHLLTLTRGGATKVRHELGLSVEAMGNTRYREMQNAAQALNIDSLVVLDLPDGGLKEMNPIGLEEMVHRHIQQYLPDVVVTYAVHGNSGHPDHLVAHAIIKRLFCQLQFGKVAYAPRRLAFFTLSEEQAERSPVPLRHSDDGAIDCTVACAPEDMDRGEAALAAYTTYADVIAHHRPLEHIGPHVHFELFDETHEPLLDDLFADLPPAAYMVEE